MPPANTPRDQDPTPQPGLKRTDKSSATPPTDTPATTKTPDPIEAPGTQGVKSETDRSKAYGPGGGTPVGTQTSTPTDSAAPGRDSSSTTNTADIDNPAPTARPGQIDETGSRTSGEAF